MTNENKCNSLTNCITTIDKIIEELNQAKYFLLHQKFNLAEDELINSLSETINALRCINSLEQPQPSPCNKKCINHAPPRTANLTKDTKYVTPSGVVITWIDNTITVSEPGTPPDIWSVSGTPLTLKDVTGKVQQIPTPNALIFLEDGSSLIVGTNAIGGPISKARYIFSGNLSLQAVQGYATNQTEVYVNDSNKSKVAVGTLNQILG